MKKGYYIHFQGRESIGVSKKIDMQLAEFQKYYDVTELEIKSVKRNLFQRIIGLVPTASIKRKYEEAFENIENPDFIYARRTVADREYVSFWKSVKRKFPNCKIIIEIFTYPYDKDDFGKWNAWPFYFKEKLYRRYLKKYIDRFVTYTDDKEIFGVKTICTTNGIDCDVVKLVEGDYQERRMNMLGVAYMQRQHGYERVIKGLARYYQDKNRDYKVTLQLVGDGPEKKYYEELVDQYGLRDYVEFYKTICGNELDSMYDRADVALAAFGMYKVKFSGAIGALKTRECLAKGLPLISGSPIDVLEPEFKYAKIFPNNNSIIDINAVVDFFEHIKDKRTKHEVAEDIRNQAEKKISMHVVMKPIIDFIN